jgi:hypothetical protein
MENLEIENRATCCCTEQLGTEKIATCCRMVQLGTENVAAGKIYKQRIKQHVAAWYS